jgi:hypothetical protein
MKSTDREHFAALMAGVGELYGKPLSPQLLAIYWEGLKDCDFDEVRVAVNLHVRNPDTGQFMPKIADIIKFLEGNTLTQAMRAWQKVQDAMRRVGTYASVVFDDPLIHAVLDDMGGWQLLGRVQDDEIQFKAREFEKRYQTYKLKPPATYPRKLHGIFEIENTRLGYPPPEPVLIGDEERAMLVFNSAGEMRRLTFKPVAQLVET